MKVRKVNMNLMNMNMNMNLILVKSLEAPKLLHICQIPQRNSLFSEKDKKIIKYLCAKLILGGKINKILLDIV